MKICAVVPSHDHSGVIGEVVRALRGHGLPVFVIDDGSAAAHAEKIAALHDPRNGVTVTRFPQNQGKGAAVMAGFRQAFAADFTHALQIDADGQHDAASVPHFLNLSAVSPDALISGRPIYDASAPLGRRIGRWITHIWVWIETLSFHIRDSMCGFRLYPLAPVMALMAEEKIGSGMDFDTDIMVRLFRRGVSVIETPVRVVYPLGNSSNFNMLRDNGRITVMHTRLFFSLFRPRRKPHHWARLRERGAAWGLASSAAAFRLFGRRGIRLIMAPVVFYFYLSGSAQRRASRLFLTRALGRTPRVSERCRHFLSFAGNAVDSFAGWTEALPTDFVKAADAAQLESFGRDPRGALIVISHLGNADLARAAMDPVSRARLTVLVHTRNAVNYNRLLAKNNPAAAFNVVEVTDFGPETIIALKEKVDRGGWIVIAGDRVPVASHGRTVAVPFLGHAAPFAQGPWLLGALMDCPVVLLFCLKEGEGYRLMLESFAERIELPRGARDSALAGYASHYAARLEHYAREAPLQWFNFYDFWANGDDHG